jgi:SsrA-binding protein
MKIINRRARYDYQITETMEAGIQLIGSEVKSIKNGRIKLDGSYVRILAGEAFLINASIPKYEFASLKDYKPTQTRKLLFHKKQLTSLETKIQQKKLTLIPVSVYTNKRNVIKVEVGLARAKKGPDKRQKIKQQDLDRDVQRELRSKS